jgi:hypothetical protein
MKKLILLLAVSGLFLSACEKDSISGDGNVAMEKRSLGGFSKVFTSGSTLVHITKASNFSINVKGYENLLPYLETSVQNGTLKIEIDKDMRVKNANYEVFITMPDLSAISTEGSGDVDVLGDFSGNTDFELKISGSANISFEKGSTQNLSTRIEGSGDIKAFGLVAADAKPITSGSGDTEIGITNKLDARISGSGNVYYKGSPVSVDTNISGSGKVIKQ